MHEFEKISKEVEVANAWFEYEMSLLEVSSIFTEDGDKSVDKNFFVQLTKKVVEFIGKILKSLKDAIQKFVTGIFCKKVNELDDEKRKKLFQAKLDATDYAKIHKYDEETQQKIKRAKSVEEIDAIMKEYKKKRVKICALTTTVTVGAMFAFLNAKHNACVRELERMMTGTRFDGNNELDKARAIADAAITKNISNEYWNMYSLYGSKFADYIKHAPAYAVKDDIKYKRVLLPPQDHQITKETHDRIKKMSTFQLENRIEGAKYQMSRSMRNMDTSMQRGRYRY